VAGVDAEKAGEAVEVPLAVGVVDVCPFAPGDDRDLVPAAGPRVKNSGNTADPAQVTRLT